MLIEELKLRHVLQHKCMIIRMTTPATLSTRVQNIIDKLTVLTSGISESYDNNFSVAKKETDSVVQTQIADYNNKTEMYNRLFQEEEYELQNSGGRTRQQTLQEYVILLFFSAYALFFITAFVYSNMFYGLEKTIQIAVGLLILLVPIVILMIKYL